MKNQKLEIQKNQRIQDKIPTVKISLMTHNAQQTSVPKQETTANIV